MRVEFGPAAADLLFVLAGFGVLNAIGLLRSSLWDVVAAVGLAFLAGISFVITVAIALLTLGVSFELPQFVAVSLATAGIGLGIRRQWLGAFRRGRTRLPDVRPLMRRTSPQSWIAAVTLLAFALYAIVGGSMARVRPLTEWDSWSIWSRKAELLFYSGSLPADVFSSSAYVFMHADYPILLPVFESIHYRAMGTIDTQAIHLQFWLLLVGFAWATLYLGLRRGSLFAWLPLVAAVSVAPAVHGQLLFAYADIPMALFLALGVLLLGEWLTTRDGRLLALAALFLAAAASTKNEGLMAAAGALVVAAVVTALGSRRSGLRALGLGAVGFAAAILPWRIWVAVQGIHGDIPVGSGLDPTYLADRAERVWPSVQALHMQLIDQANWLYVVPLSAAIALVSLLVAGRAAPAAFYLATGGVAFAALIWAYWVSPNEPLSFYLGTSASRVVDAVAAIAFAAVLQLTPSGRDAWTIPSSEGRVPWA
jgi:hypothetical protein